MFRSIKSRSLKSYQDYHMLTTIVAAGTSSELVHRDKGGAALCTIAGDGGGGSCMDIIPSIACWSPGHFLFVLPTLVLLLPFCVGIIHLQVEYQPGSQSVVEDKLGLIAAFLVKFLLALVSSCLGDCYPFVIVLTTELCVCALLFMAYVDCHRVSYQDRHIVFGGITSRALKSIVPRLPHVVHHCRRRYRRDACNVLSIHAVRVVGLLFAAANGFFSLYVFVEVYGDPADRSLAALFRVLRHSCSVAPPSPPTPTPTAASASSSWSAPLPAAAAASSSSSWASNSSQPVTLQSAFSYATFAAMCLTNAVVLMLGVFWYIRQRRTWVAADNSTVDLDSTDYFSILKLTKRHMRRGLAFQLRTSVQLEGAKAAIPIDAESLKHVLHSKHGGDDQLAVMIDDVDPKSVAGNRTLGAIKKKTLVRRKTRPPQAKVAISFAMPSVELRERTRLGSKRTQTSLTLTPFSSAYSGCGLPSVRNV